MNSLSGPQMVERVIKKSLSTGSVMVALVLWNFGDFQNKLLELIKEIQERTTTPKNNHTMYLSDTRENHHCNAFSEGIYCIQGAHALQISLYNWSASSSSRECHFGYCTYSTDTFQWPLDTFLQKCTAIYLNDIVYSTQILSSSFMGSSSFGFFEERGFYCQP